MLVMESPVLPSWEDKSEEHAARASRVAWAQILVEINGVRRFAATPTRTTCKQQLRATGCRAGLRSDSTMPQPGARVQSKELIASISVEYSSVGRTLLSVAFDFGFEQVATPRRKD